MIEEDSSMDKILVKEVGDIMVVGATFGLKAFARWVLRHELWAVNDLVRELQGRLKVKPHNNRVHER